MLVPIIRLRLISVSDYTGSKTFYQILPKTCSLRSVKAKNHSSSVGKLSTKQKLISKHCSSGSENPPFSKVRSRSLDTNKCNNKKTKI